MCRDPLVQEIRAIRESYAERFNFDLGAIYRDLQAQDQQSGRRIVPAPREAPTTRARAADGHAPVSDSPHRG
jgi:hypothetical protein